MRIVTALSCSGTRSTVSALHGRRIRGYGRSRLRPSSEIRFCGHPRARYRLGAHSSLGAAMMRKPNTIDFSAAAEVYEASRSGGADKAEAMRAAARILEQLRREHSFT